MPELKDILNAINNTKDYTLITSENSSEYLPFVVNRCMSYYPETILIANQVNQYGLLPNELQFKYYVNTVSRKKRYAPWLKYKVSDDVNTIKEYYGCSTKKAKELVKHTNKEMIIEMKQSLDKGGLKKSKY
jgi:hypothetical protein